MPPGQLSWDEIRDVDGGKEKTLTLATLSSQLTAVEEVVERNMIFFFLQTQNPVVPLAGSVPCQTNDRNQEEHITWETENKLTQQKFF